MVLIYFLYLYYHILMILSIFLFIFLLIFLIYFASVYNLLLPVTQTISHEAILMAYCFGGNFTYISLHTDNRNHICCTIKDNSNRNHICCTGPTPCGAHGLTQNLPLSLPASNRGHQVYLLYPLYSRTRG